MGAIRIRDACALGRYLADHASSLQDIAPTPAADLKAAASAFARLPKGKRIDDVAELIALVPELQQRLRNEEKERRQLDKRLKRAETTAASVKAKLDQARDELKAAKSTIKQLRSERQSEATRGKASRTGEKVDINSAAPSQLASLPGVGPSLARRLREFVETNGPIRDLQQLLGVHGVGPRTVNACRDLVVVEGPRPTTQSANADREQSLGAWSPPEMLEFRGRPNFEDRLIAFERHARRLESDFVKFGKPVLDHLERVADVFRRFERHPIHRLAARLAWLVEVGGMQSLKDGVPWQRHDLGAYSVRDAVRDEVMRTDIDADEMKSLCVVLRLGAPEFASVEQGVSFLAEKLAIRASLR